jgi:uncharacterized protein YndB with AHSA1/START domain
MRRIRLKTQRVIVHAPRALVFEVVAAGGQVVERRSDTELVKEFKTTVGRRKVTTLELVRLRPPERIEYRWLEGPLHRVEEAIEMAEPAAGATEITYRGSFWTRALGWVRARARIKRSVDRAVTEHLQQAKTIAEKRARSRAQGQ